MTIETLKQLFKFSWSQAFSDQNGKSSITSIAYFIVTITGCIGFIKSIFIKDVNLTMWSATVIGIGVGGYTGKKIVDGKAQSMGITEPGTIQQTVTETPPVTTTQTTITPKQ